MNHRFVFLTLAGLLTALSTVWAQPSADQQPKEGELRIPRSMVSLIDQVQVPARQAGVLKQLLLEDGTLVREGQTVTKGQILGALDDQDAKARKRAAETEHKVSMAEQGKAEANIVAAAKTVEVAEAELAESHDINKRSPRAVPQTQVRRQELTVERAASESVVADRDLETATLTIDAKQAQVEVASITLNMHQIEAPQDGMIVQIYRHVGEWVNPGDSIMRIVYLDKLRVEGFVDARSYTPDEVQGREVEITAFLPNGRTEKFQSTISFVSPIVETSGEFRVWCDVPNRQHNGHWILRPGMDTDMTIRLNSQPARVAAR